LTRDTRLTLSRVGLDNDRLDDAVLKDDDAALEAGAAKDGVGVEDEAKCRGEGAGVVAGYAAKSE
jgi:hypothetical protein